MFPLSHSFRQFDSFPTNRFVFFYILRPEPDRHSWDSQRHTRTEVPPSSPLLVQGESFAHSFLKVIGIRSRTFNGFVTGFVPLLIFFIFFFLFLALNRFSGLCAAIRLQTQLNLSTYQVFELEPDLGGTWWSNTYPGTVHNSFYEERIICSLREQREDPDLYFDLYSSLSFLN